MSGTVGPLPSLYPPGTGTPFATTVVSRSPAATDDTNAGYVVGSLWSAPAGLFVAQQVNAGQAVWVPSTVTALPVDAVGGTAPIAAYGMSKLVAAYAGKAINVVRASDSTNLDIGFLANGQLDTASMDAFGANTTLTVAKWYDQSGNANHATQTTAANQPSLSSTSLTGNCRSVIFDSQIDSNPSSSTQKWMALPAGVAATSNTCSVFVVTKPYTSFRLIYWTELTATHPQTFYAGYLNTTHNTVEMFWFGTQAPSGAACSLPGIYGYVSGASITLYAGNNAPVTGTTQGAFSLAGGYLGVSALTLSTASGYNEMAGVVIYARALNTATDVVTLQQALTRTFGLTPQVQDVFVIAGDSITEGYGATYLQNRPAQTTRLVNKPLAFYNTGFFGDTLVHQLSIYPACVAPLYNPYSRNNLVEIFAGTNDLTVQSPVDLTGAIIYSSTIAYVAAAHATGFKVIVGTMLPRPTWAVGSQQDNARLAFNILVRSNTAGADAIADYAADPTMGVQANCSNPVFYAAGPHPTSLGYGYLAQIEAAAVNSLLQ